MRAFREKGRHVGVLQVPLQPLQEIFATHGEFRQHQNSFRIDLDLVLEVRKVGESGAKLVRPSVLNEPFRLCTSTKCMQTKGIRAGVLTIRG